MYVQRNLAQKLWIESFIGVHCTVEAGVTIKNLSIKRKRGKINRECVSSECVYLVAFVM